MSTKVNNAVWQESFSLGNIMIDEQHTRIFEILAKLTNLCKRGSSKGKLKNMMDYLIYFIIHHFCDEETMQIKYNYYDFKRHQDQHNEFKAILADILYQFDEDGSAAKLAHELNEVAAQWMIAHITLEDRKVWEYLQVFNHRQIS